MIVHPDSRESLAHPRLWLAFATMLLVSGIANTFPVFFPALLAEFGGSRAATASAISLLWLGGAVLGPVAGQLIDRWSPRLVAALGLGACALGLAGATVAPSLGLFIGALGLGGGVGIGLTGFVTQAAVIRETYVRRRGAATGIAFSGSMAGYVLSPPVQWAIQALGWRATLGGYLLLVLGLVPLVLRFYPARLAAAHPATAATSSVAAVPDRTTGEIVRSVPFWTLAFLFFNAPLVGYLVTVQQVLYFTSVGFPLREAAAMLAIGGVLSTSGRALIGVVADRFGAPAMGLVTLTMSLIGTVCLVGVEAWPTRLLAYGYVLFVFSVLGTRAVLVPLLVPRLAPPARFGTVFGWLVGINSAGAALGPFLSGALYDLTRSYLVVFATAAALIALSIVALLAFLERTAMPAQHRGLRSMSSG